LNKELARRDDLEAWAYLTIEFFDLKILPWKDDQVTSSVLHKKQKLIDGQCKLINSMYSCYIFSVPMVFVPITLRFKQILRYIASMRHHERPDYLFIQQILQEIRVEKEIGKLTVQNK
jgi:hypothetical protein